MQIILFVVVVSSATLAIVRNYAYGEVPLRLQPKTEAVSVLIDRQIRPLPRCCGGTGGGGGGRGGGGWGW